MRDKILGIELMGERKYGEIFQCVQCKHMIMTSEEKNLGDENMGTF